MSSLGSPSTFFLAKKKAYEVERSLRFNDGDSPSLTRSPSGDGNKQTFTFSWWQKITQPNDYPITFSVGSTSLTTGFWEMRLGSLGLYLRFKDSSTVVLNSNAKFRDPSAWYHCVIAVDTTKATNSERIKMYVNNQQITSFQYENYPSQNLSFRVNTTDQHQWGYGKSSSGAVDGPLDGYLAEINFIDGFQYDPSYFGETNPATGQWNPKKYTGGYGTNGYYLNFSDNSGTTATTLGKDSSGNGNNFTPNNFVTGDAMKDSPTNNFATMNPLNGHTGISEGNLRFNSYNDSSGPRSVQSTIALPKSGKWYWETRFQEDYLHSIYMGLSQIQMSTGYLTTPTVYYDSSNGNIVATGESNVSGGSWYNIGSGNSHIISIAVDVDNNSVKFYKDNSLQGTITLPTLTSSQEYFFTWANSSGGSNSGLNNTFNFGADSTFQGQTSSGGNTDANGIGDFKYAPPSGHLALCTANLPDPTIKLPNKHFDTLLYTGNGSGQTLSGLNFSPDWLWIKSRSSTEPHELNDQVRGTLKSLSSNLTSAENTASGRIEAFTSDGFTLGNSGNVNSNSETFVAWNWDAGETDGKTYTVTVVDDSGNKYRFDGFAANAVTLDLAEGGTYIFNYPSGHPFKFSTTADGTHGGGSEYTTGVTHNSSTQVTIVVAASAPTLYYYCSSHSGMGGAVNTNSTLGSSNFDGTIQTRVKVNATAGFSIITYTGTGSLGTVGHGLGVKPDGIFFKNRDQAHGWLVYHSSNGATKNLSLSNNAAVGTANNKFNDTEPTSSVITLKTAADSNQSGQDTVAYCFSEVAGYSKFGKYTGNGLNNGTFVYTGFKVTWLLIKKTNTTESWILADTKRNSNAGRESPADSYLLADQANAESTGIIYDMLSNGFKFRSTSQNTSGHTYVYFAFAESPFKYSRAR